MNVYEMTKITQRFNQILGASQTLKNKRLKQFRNELLQDHLKNPSQFKARMIMRIDWEIDWSSSFKNHVKGVI